MTDAPEPTATLAVFQLDVDADAGIAAAAAAVEEGECIVIPTDTVYGIGADAFSSASVQKLLDAKERGRDMPPPVLIAEPSMLRALASDVPAAAMALAKAHWPGALTLILRSQRTLKLEIGETDGTVAVRVPDHDGARALLRRTGPLAVSSANISGQPAATSCDEALTSLGDRVAVYLDGGATDGQGASTIIDFTTSEHGLVLRQGALAFELLKETAPLLQPLPEPELAAPADDAAGGEPTDDAADEPTLAIDGPPVQDVEPTVVLDAQPEAERATE